MHGRAARQLKHGLPKIRQRRRVAILADDFRIFERRDGRCPAMLENDLILDLDSVEHESDRESLDIRARRLHAGRKAADRSLKLRRVDIARLKPGREADIRHDGGKRRALAGRAEEEYPLRGNRAVACRGAEHDA